MKNGILTKLVLISAALFSVETLFAQSSSSGSSILLSTIILISILLVLGVIVMVGDNLISIEAKQSGIDLEKENLSVMPRLKELMAPSLPSYTSGYRSTILKKGFKLNLLGEPSSSVQDGNSTRYAVQPPNFRGIAPIPKLEVEVGSSVKAGDPVFFDKSNPAIKYVAPVSGEVVEINRGAKRAITEIVILADKDQKSRKYSVPDLNQSSRQQLVDFLMDSGAWMLFHQRPYDVVANPEWVPANIFISTFDSAPLSPDSNLVVEGKGRDFQKGLDVLGKLTSGKVYLGLNANSATPPSDVFMHAKGVEKRFFHGKHPSGNVGVHIHHIQPINAGETVWTLGVQDVITLGHLFNEGAWNTSRLVALAGAEVENPRHIRTFAGANIGDLVKGNLKQDHVRMISGDVLTGEAKSANEFLNFSDDQISVVQEGDYYEMFGWLLPQKSRPSHSKTYPNFLFPDAKYSVDTNTHGEGRAFVVTGQYEDVLPMDIYPQHLMKAILANDFEKMEGLGIYELIEEDVALCEFVCTSKQPLQKILRSGLDKMRDQG